MGRKAQTGQERLMSEIKIYGVIQNGEFCAMPEQQRLEAHYLKEYKDGTLAERITRKFGQPKTKHQLGAHFGLALAIIIAEFDDRGYDTSFLYRIDKPTGIRIDKDLLKDYFYSVCPIFEAGQRITLSKATSEQASKHFNDVRNWASSQWQIVIPEPDKERKHKF